jgi:hypothetical protein
MDCDFLLKKNNVLFRLSGLGGKQQNHVNMSVIAQYSLILKKLNANKKICFSFTSFENIIRKFCKKGCQTAKSTFDRYYSNFNCLMYLTLPLSFFRQSSKHPLVCMWLQFVYINILFWMVMFVLQSQALPFL